MYKRIWSPENIHCDCHSINVLVFKCHQSAIKEALQCTHMLHIQLTRDILYYTTTGNAKAIAFYLYSCRVVEHRFKILTIWKTYTAILYIISHTLITSFAHFIIKLLARSALVKPMCFHYTSLVVRFFDSKLLCFVFNKFTSWKNR